MMADISTEQEQALVRAQGLCGALTQDLTVLSVCIRPAGHHHPSPVVAPPPLTWWQLSSSVRDRVTAILTLAEAATGVPMDLDAVIALDRACKDEGLWLARTLLEAFVTIDRLEDENAELKAQRDRQRQAVSNLPIENLWLNGGNE